MSFERLAVRLFNAMSFSEAKEILGLPLTQAYSPEDLIKAYRRKAIENHPDRGGDPRKMVEINVAKEILEGKRVNDRTEVSRPKETDEVIRRRRRQIQKDMDIGQIQQNQANATEAFQAAWASFDSFLNGYRMDVKEFLTDTFAETVDLIHDQAMEAQEQNTANRQALVLTQMLLGQGLKLSSKYSQLKKMSKWVPGVPNIDSLRLFYAEAQKYLITFHAMRETSGKLMKLIVTSEDVPMAWDNIYSHTHQVIINFDDDYKDFDSKILTRAESVIHRAVEATQVKLEYEYKVRPDKEWVDWKIPDDFLTAVEQIRATP